MRKILTDDTKRELSMHGSEQFPMTVSHDDLWDFEGKRVSVIGRETGVRLRRKRNAVYSGWPGNATKSVRARDFCSIRMFRTAAIRLVGSRFVTVPCWYARIFYTENSGVMWNESAFVRSCRILRYRASVLEPERCGSGMSCKSLIWWKKSLTGQLLL